ncbi:terminase small subunit [Sporomusa sphaeroides DSM 2875]|uniref:terminase small subunit n=1 Tax=Sporomusa sphaeroides TaxID=47679 RepID=UPI00202E36C2|nr:terminase small subunit [Sporomusa sphaeroides]MCM0760275.1 terminase small subunit [Sporomusa sphaeroides DSM 2875]
MAKLNARHKRFVTEYLVDLNGTQAAIRAGYSPKTANEQAARLLANVSIQEAIQEAMKKREQRTEITADRVLKEIFSIFEADAREISELHRCCCRYCWGQGFQYQFTLGEMRDRQEQYNLDATNAMLKGESIGPFNPRGGIGYNATKPPNPDCPECFGQGELKPFFHDTRKLSAAAKSLYAGVKITKDGIEVKMHSKDKMIELLGRHLGMFKEKVEVSGEGGAPLNVIFNIPRPPKE